MRAYFKSLYQRTMRDAYATAIKEVSAALTSDGRCLDCGAQGGQTYDAICREIPFSSKRYFGLEWNHASIRPGRQGGLRVIQGASGTNTCATHTDGRPDTATSTAKSRELQLVRHATG